MKALLRTSLAILCTVLPLAAQDLPYKISVKQMWCEDKSEFGHDEIYWLVGKKTTTGVDASEVLPSAGSQWDCRNKRNYAEGIVLMAGTLPPGHTAALSVVVMEQDDSGEGDRVAAAGAVTASVGLGLTSTVATAPAGIVTAIAGGVATVVGAAMHADKDDTMGSFSIVVKNEGGTLQWYRAAGPHTEDLSIDWKNLEFRPQGSIKGDDYQYRLYLTAE